MSATKHTPGPWIVDDLSGTVNAHNGVVTSFEDSDYTREQDLFNAALIAAAPDMLAALRECVEVLDIAEMYGLYGKGSLGEADIIDSRGMARAAIAKAESRTDA